MQPTLEKHATKFAANVLTAGCGKPGEDVTDAGRQTHAYIPVFRRPTAAAASAYLGRWDC